MNLARFSASSWGLGQVTRIGVREILVWLFVALGCVFLGGVIALFPPLIPIGFIGAAIYLLLLWNFPWVGICCYLAVVLLSPDFKITDVATAATLGVLGFRVILNGAYVGVPKRPLVLYFLFMGLMVFSVLLGKYWFSNETPFLYRDARVLLYWAWFPVVACMAGSSAQGAQKIWRVIVFVAVLISLLALVQYATGMQFVAEGRVGSLETLGAYDQSATRVQMPGFYFVSVALMATVVAANESLKKFFILAPCLVLFAVALYANFGRALWVWTLAGVLSACFFMVRVRAVRLLLFLIVFVLFVGGLLAVIKPAALDTIGARVVSIFSEGGGRTSYGWRKLENEDAIKNILQSPVVGVGMGGEYRRWMGEVSVFKEHTRYMHQSYLYVALKAGVPALLALVGFFMYALRSGFHAVRYAQNRHGASAPMIAMLVGMPAVMALSVTQPELMSAFGAMFYCLTTAYLFRIGSTAEVQGVADAA